MRVGKVTSQDQAFLFGLNVSTSAESGTDPVADAMRAEDLGFDFVSASDHLHGRAPTYEPWTMLSWIAAATSRIRVATRVLAVPHRHPAVLAKMAETFDRLSSGRLILGLGGGAVDEEFRALGLGMRSPADKVDGLSEAILITRGSGRSLPLRSRGGSIGPTDSGWSRSRTVQFPSGLEPMAIGLWPSPEPWPMAGSPPSATPHPSK